MTVPKRASLMAELVRLGVRLFLKQRTDYRDLKRSRTGFRAMERWVPQPPRSTKVVALSAGGVPSERVITLAARASHHVLYLHGGGYRTGALPLFRHFTWRVADAAKACVLAIAYRLAPEHPFPAALEDAVAAYQWLLEQGADPQRISVLGDSAGGGLAFGLLLKLRDEGVPLPGAAVGLSPWTDLALTGASLKTNAASDPMLDAGAVPRFAAEYLGGADPRNPYASPLYGDLRNLPPALIQVGSDEILLDDAVRLAERLRNAGGDAELQVWPRMPHDFQMFAPILPEARAAIAQIGDFLHRIEDR